MQCSEEVRLHRAGRTAAWALGRLGLFDKAVHQGLLNPVHREARTRCQWFLASGTLQSAFGQGVRGGGMSQAERTAFRVVARNWWQQRHPQRGGCEANGHSRGDSEAQPRYRQQVFTQ